jgi:hypothetical protein
MSSDGKQWMVLIAVIGGIILITVIGSIIFTKLLMLISC